MSNLLKAYNVVCENRDKRIIDSNQAMSDAIIRIKEQIEAQGYEGKPEFVQGLDAENVEGLLYSENDDEGERIISGNVISPEGDFLQKTEEDLTLARERISEAEEQARYILENARGDADIIIQEAASKADEIIATANEAAFAKGYDEGKAKAESEVQAKLAELEATRMQLNEEYQEKVRNLEPELVDAILRVVMDVTHVISEDKKDLVAGLIGNVLNGDINSKTFVIRVSKDDSDFVKKNKDKLIEEVDKVEDIIVVEDSTMKKGQCMVETDFGIYDCSLDVQMEALVREIKLLACAVGNE